MSIILAALQSIGVGLFCSIWYAVTTIQERYYSGINDLFFCGILRYFLIFRTEYRLKLILLRNLTCASRQRLESYTTLSFLVDHHLERSTGRLINDREIDWSKNLIGISDILLNSPCVVMIKSSILSSFNFKKVSFSHIHKTWCNSHGGRPKKILPYQHDMAS